MDEIEFNVQSAKNHTEQHYAVDFDSTIAHYESWDKQGNEIGKPIKPMIDKIKEWLKSGVKVSIFTARLSHNRIESERQIALITKFLIENGLPDNLQITSMKMHYFTKFFDDRAYHVIPNVGIIEGNYEN